MCYEILEKAGKQGLEQPEGSMPHTAGSVSPPKVGALVRLRVVFSDRGWNGLSRVEADGVANLLKGDGKLVFDGFDGDIEDLSDFAVFEAVFFHQLENDLAFGGELLYRTFDEREHIGRDQELFGIEIDAGEFRLEFFYRIGRYPFVPADIVEGGIAGRYIKVHPQIFDLFELASPFPDMDKHIRNNFFGGLFRLDKGFGKQEKRRIKGSK